MNPKDYNPATQGTLIGVGGPPGTGKSYFALSAIKWANAQGRKAALGLLLAEELDGYAGTDIAETEIFVDDGWRPYANQYRAGAFNKLIRWLSSLEKREDITVVVLDPSLSDATNLAMQEVLAPYDTDDPKDLNGINGPGSAYLAHNRLINQLLSVVGRLKRCGKHVICTFHVKMNEAEGVGEAKKKADMAGKVVLKFADQLLPSMLSSIRQEVAKRFSLWLYTFCEGTGETTKFRMRSTRSQTSPAKSRIQLLFDKPFNQSGFPNEFGVLLKAIERGQNGTH